MRIICISARESHKRKDLPAGTAIPTQEAKNVVAIWVRDGTLPRGGKAQAELVRICRQNGTPVQNGDFATALNRLKALVEVPPATNATPATTPSPAAPGGSAEASAAAPAAGTSVSETPSPAEVVSIVANINKKNPTPVTQALMLAYRPSELSQLKFDETARNWSDPRAVNKATQTMASQMTGDSDRMGQAKKAEEREAFRSSLNASGSLFAMADLIGEQSVSTVLGPAMATLQNMKRLKDVPTDFFRMAIPFYRAAVPQDQDTQSDLEKLQKTVLAIYRLDHRELTEKVLSRGYAAAKNDMRSDPLDSALKAAPAEYTADAVEDGMSGFTSAYIEKMKANPQEALDDKHLAELGRSLFLAVFMAMNRKLASAPGMQQFFARTVDEAKGRLTGCDSLLPKNYKAALTGFLGSKTTDPKASTREAILFSQFKAQSDAVKADAKSMITPTNEQMSLLKADILAIGRVYARSKTRHVVERDWPTIQEAQEVANWVAQVLIAAFGELNTAKGKAYLEDNVSKLSNVWPDWSQSISGNVTKNKGSPVTILLGLYGKRMSAHRMSQDEYHEIADLVKQTVLSKVTQAAGRIAAETAQQPVQSGPDAERSRPEKFRRLLKVLAESDNHILEPRIINDVLADKGRQLVTGGDIGMADMVISSYAVSRPNEVPTPTRLQAVSWKILEEIKGWGAHHHKREESGKVEPYKWKHDERDEARLAKEQDEAKRPKDQNNPTPEPPLVDDSDGSDNHSADEMAADETDIGVWGHEDTIAFASVVLWVLVAKAKGVR